MTKPPRTQRAGRPCPVRTAVPSTAASGATRCASNTAEICDADGSYHELADCDVVSERSGAPFVCAFVDETTEDGRDHRAHLRAREARRRCGGRRWAMKGYLQSLPVVGKCSSTSSPRRSGRSGASCRTTSARASSTRRARSRCSSSRAVSKRLGIQSRDRFSRTSRRPSAGAFTRRSRSARRRAAGISGTRSSSASTSTSTSCSTIERAGPRGQLPAEGAARARWEAEAYRSNLEPRSSGARAPRLGVADRVGC